MVGGGIEQCLKGVVRAVALRVSSNNQPSINIVGGGSRMLASHSVSLCVPGTDSTGGCGRWIRRRFRRRGCR
jgi:hypothetical protein